MVFIVKCSMEPMMRKLVPAAVVAAFLAGPLAAETPDAAPIGVTRAVAAAEKALSARAVEAELDTWKGRLVYDVELVRGDALHDAVIDAQTGKLLASGKQRWESLWASWFDKDRFATTSRPLSATLAALEAETGGRVEEVSLDDDGGRAVYEVELATAAGVAEIALDPATGKRLARRLDD